ncbi:Tar ligand binding domain-containing protein [Candidatus Nitrotoga arctica]|uniref:histidine kinase n=1 Tax=Candidatus Nitrotoga arctica TaxID=453162 RepID=A0ABN8AQF9_9PROT|nr:Tar ligand binding domain-containing protein [Candidatus Nitrotoga arctica]CAG9933922.1 Histidine kinase [Candidatus Nitrotoga arctica]
MFKNLTIKTRLIFILSFLVVFLLGIEMLGLLGMSKANDGLKTVYEDRVIPLGQLGHIESLLQQSRLSIAVALVTPTPEVIDNNTATFEKNVKEINKTWEEYLATYLTPEEEKLADKFSQDRKKFITEGLIPAVAALRTHEIKEANQIVVEKVRPLYDLVKEDISALIDLQLDITKQEYRYQQNRYATIRNIFIALIIFVLALVVLISVAVTRVVFRPLEKAVEIARSVAAGDFTQQIEVRSADEIGQLLQALKEMNDSLVKTVGQLRDSETHVRAMLNNLIEGIITINEYGVIGTFNSAAERIFGYTEAEVVDKNVSMLMPAPYREAHDGYLARYLQTREKNIIGISREVVGLRKDGTTFPMELAVIETRQGERHIFTGSLRDISARKQAEEQRARLIHELESTHEELKSFAYVVSHDLKAPLRAISALAGWLSHDYSDKFDEEGKEHMRLLIKRVYRMDNLINGILQYSRVGQVKEKVIAVDLDQLVREVLDLLSPPANIVVSIDNTLPTVMAEPTRIEQVFQNLLSNAIKYMDKPQGEIRIACSSEDKQWKFIIADNGSGIELRHFERIFQLFQTLAPRDRVEGTGVGLSLVKKIVEMYGGKIWLESKVGEGSTFFFTLPKSVTTASSN